MAVAVALGACSLFDDSAASAPMLRLTPVGDAARLVPGEIGVNGEGINTDFWGRVWNGSGLLAAVHELRPGNVRVFGGTSANGWGWQQGRLVASPPAPIAGYRAGKPDSAIRLGTFATVLRSGSADAVFDLNMVTRSLPDQLAMLRKAETAGMRVTRVELGNELWSPAYSARFPTGAAYAAEANRWIAAIHSAFPGAAVAVDVTMRGDEGDVRRRTWNRQVFAQIRGADAVSVHAYIRADRSDPTGVVGQATATYTAMMTALNDVVPRTMPVWITEWNYRPSTVRRSGTWQEALGNAMFAVQALADGRVELLDMHSMIDLQDGLFPVITVARDGTTFGLSANGQMLRALLWTARGCDRVRALRSSPGWAGFDGIECTGQHKTSVFLINASDDSIRTDLRTVASTQWRGSTTTSVPGSARAAANTGRAVVNGSVVEVPAWSFSAVTSTP